MKLKQYEVESRVEFFSEPIGDTLRRYRTIKKYAYILHDKDPDTSPHYHIYLNFGNSGVDSKLVAEWFGLQESQVNKVRGRSTDMLQYLTHSNPSQKHKYQYSPSEVISNFDFEEEIKKSKIIGNFKEYSYAKQLEYIDSLPIDEKGKNYDKLEKLWKIHCKVLTMNPERNLSVMFIEGKTGTGKTYHAKRIAEGKHYDICISSAANDPWQDYMGQKCIIADDVRDSNFSFEELLKLLDNDTASSVQARYGNKVLSCELMILTSSVPLSFWYSFLAYSRKEDLTQLYRRITAYIILTEDEVQLYDGVDVKGKPLGLPRIYKNDVKKLKMQPKKKVDFGEVLSEICEEYSIEELIERYGTKR